MLLAATAPPMSSAETLSPWADVAPLVVSLGALLIALAAFVERRRASSAHHVQRFSEYYDSIEMYEALRTMRHWVDALGDHDPNQVARSVMEALQTQSGRIILGGPITHDNQPAYIDAMRRHVSSYFERLCQFREARYLRHKDFRLLITLAGEQLMIQAIAPLHRAKIAVELEQLDHSDEAGRVRVEGWSAKFHRHLLLVQNPTRRTLWRQRLSMKD